MTNRFGTSLPVHRSGGCNWVAPRPHTDASLRYLKNGPIQPMHKPTLLDKLFGRG